MLAAEESHYLLHVLRLRAGERVNVFDGRGRDADATLSAGPAGGGRAKRAGECQVELQLTNTRTRPPPAPEITLLQALPKAARMDWILEKATELGIRAIQPLITQRVVGAEGRGREDGKADRWRRVVLSAARQCNTVWVPEVLPLKSFAEYESSLPAFDLVIFGCLTEAARPLRDVLRSYEDRPPRRVALLIGPEGDFTPDETRSALTAGVVPVTFGSRVLRVETAALFGLSVLLYELGGVTQAPVVSVSGM
jgi:16S rRNA (uracil1498-N3)-methyltransferase